MLTTVNPFTQPAAIFKPTCPLLIYNPRTVTSPRRARVNCYGRAEEQDEMKVTDLQHGKGTEKAAAIMSHESD